MLRDHSLPRCMPCAACFSCPNARLGTHRGLGSRSCGMCRWFGEHVLYMICNNMITITLTVMLIILYVYTMRRHAVLGRPTIHHHHPEGVVHRHFCLNSSAVAVRKVTSRRWWCIESLFACAPTHALRAERRGRAKALLASCLAAPRRALTSSDESSGNPLER